jgi:hypothetical protein
MSPALVAMFIIAHGMMHLAVWVPKPATEDPPPFSPDHSGVLAAARVAPAVTRAVALALAAVVAGLFVLAGVGVALSAGWTAGVAVAAGAAGLGLKLVYFNAWLTLGVLLDLAVVTSALADWPVALT